MWQRNDLHDVGNDNKRPPHKHKYSFWQTWIDFCWLACVWQDFPAQHIWQKSISNVTRSEKSLEQRFKPPPCWWGQWFWWTWVGVRPRSSGLVQTKMCIFDVTPWLCGRSRPGQGCCPRFRCFKGFHEWKTTGCGLTSSTIFVGHSWGLWPQEWNHRHEPNLFGGGLSSGLERWGWGGSGIRQDAPELLRHVGHRWSARVCLGREWAWLGSTPITRLFTT